MERYAVRLRSGLSPAMSAGVALSVKNKLNNSKNSHQSQPRDQGPSCPGFWQFVQFILTSLTGRQLTSDPMFFLAPVFRGWQRIVNSVNNEPLSLLMLFIVGPFCSRSRTTPQNGSWEFCYRRTIVGPTTWWSFCHETSVDSTW